MKQLMCSVVVTLFLQNMVVAVPTLMMDDPTRFLCFKAQKYT